MLVNAVIIGSSIQLTLSTGSFHIHGFNQPHVLIQGVEPIISGGQLCYVILYKGLEYIQIFITT